MAELKSMGRPLKFNNVDDMQVLIDCYVADCAEAKLMMTLPGLAMALGFADKTSLFDYQEKEEFAFCVKKARSLVEQQHVRGTSNNAGRDIFLLKNMGYSDRSLVEMMPVTVNITGKDAEL